MTTHIVEKIFCLRLSMAKSAKSAKSFWIFRFLAKPQYDNIFRHCEQSINSTMLSLRANEVSVAIHNKEIDCHDLTSSSLAMTEAFALLEIQGGKPTP